MEITRRGLLTGAAVLGGGLLLPASPAFAAGEYDVLRQRWFDLLTGGDFDSGDPDFAAALRRLDETADTHLALRDPPPTGPACSPICR
ncbi:MAG: hypothetical protein ACRDT6_15590 [Micromonosporaceae bacterium]